MRNAIIMASALGALALGVFSFTGCGGDTSGSSSGGSGGTTGASVTPDAACKSFSESLCGRLDACSPFGLKIGYGDAATCADRIKPRCLDTLDVQGVGATADDLQACADAYADMTCDDLLGGKSPDACKLTGDKADGATCAVGPECKGGICPNAKEGECGACATPVTAGGACTVGKDTCADGTYCDGMSSKCETYAAKGQTCNDMKLCAGSLSCNGGTCGDPLPQGADCSNGESCDSTVGLWCNPDSKTCTTIAVAKVGETCGLDVATGDLTLCEADSECDFQAMKCNARLKEGNSCTVDAMTGQSHCLVGLTCIAGKCSTGYPMCQ